jgi:hypothetical protein
MYKWDCTTASSAYKTKKSLCKDYKQWQSRTLEDSREKVKCRLSINKLNIKKWEMIA